MYKPMIHICINILQLNRTHGRTGIFFSSLLSYSRFVDPVAVSFDSFPYFVVAVVDFVIIIVNVVDDFSLSSQRQNINQKKGVLHS